MLGPTSIHAIALFAALLVTAPALGGPAGPGAGETRAALQGRLDAEFADGLFKVRKVAVLGSQAHTDAGGRELLLTGYRAELRFLREHQLSSWDELNVGTLVRLLGTSARHVQGVAAQGNHKGDTLRVEGTLAWERSADAWRAVASEARYAAGRGDDAPPPAEVPFGELLQQRLAELGVAFEAGELAGEEDPLATDLEQLVADVECRMADRAGQLRLATGTGSSEYDALGRGLAEQLGADGLFVRRSTGSVANVELLREGLVDAAFVQNDIAHRAYNADGLFQGKLPMGEMRALCALFPEVVHVITLDRSGIESLDDLRGVAVDVGPDDSGSRFNAAQVLAVAGLTIQDLERVQGKPAGEALDDLVTGRVQAVILTGATPYGELASRIYGLPLRTLSLSEAQVNEIAAAAPFLLPMTVPAHTYPNQATPIRTIGVSALLVAREDLPDEAVEQLLSALLDGTDTLARHTVQAYYVSADTAERGLSIPLHPAAYRLLAGRRTAPAAP